MNTTARAPLIDNPIRLPEEDFLKISGFARAIADFIKSCDTPVTIGIQGDWGIGKTSLLNLLKGHLSQRKGRDQSTPHIYINTWQHAQFRQEEWLGILILNGIVDELQNAYPEQTSSTADAVRNVAGRLAKFAFGATGQIVKKQTGFDLEAGVQAAGDHESVGLPKMSALLQEYRARFADLVHAVAPGERDRLVIMIDDLDRVTPLRAIELLEAIKNFLDVDRCVFVLAVDYKVIQQGVAQRLGTEAQQLHGKSYFDKIIQVPFNMPTTAYQMTQYIMGLLGWDIREDTVTLCGDGPFLPSPTRDARESCGFFTDITALSVGHNPRSIKRVAAYVRLLKYVRDESLRVRRNDPKSSGRSSHWNIRAAQVLYALACMQIEWPELFRHFVQHPVPGTLEQYESWDHVSSLPEVRQMLPRYPDAEQLKANITGFFDQFIVLVDRDGSGDIDIEEFRPVWDIMRDAGLTSVDLPTAGELWEPLVGRMNERASAASWVPGFVDALKASRWTDPVHCRVLPSGSRVVRVLWNSDSIGTFVTTGRDPLRLYLELEGLSETDLDDSPIKGLLSRVTGQHYGSGDWQFDVEACSNTGECTDLLNALHQLVTKSASVGPARNSS